MLVYKVYYNQLGRSIDKEHYKKKLENKFGVEIGRKIFNEDPWIGMTTEMLGSMYGKADEIHNKTNANKTFYTHVYLKRKPNSIKKTANNFVFEGDNLVRIDIKIPLIKIFDR